MEESKLYKRVVAGHPALFTAKDAAEIDALLAGRPDNKYLAAVVLGPYIEGAPDKDRAALANYLVFTREAEDSGSAFRRRLTEDGGCEPAFDRLRWFYSGLTRRHPLYPTLLKGENGVRSRKGLPLAADDSELVPTGVYTPEQLEAFHEIGSGKSGPNDGWWWVDDPPTP